VKLIVWAIRIASRFMVSYKFTPESLNVYSYGFIPRLKLKYSDIAHVERTYDINQRGPINRFSTLLDATNRLFGEGILIEKKTGFYMYVVLSPEDPERFLERLEQFRRLHAKELADAADPKKRRPRRKVMDGGPAHLPDDD